MPLPINLIYRRPTHDQITMPRFLYPPCETWCAPLTVLDFRLV